QSALIPDAYVAENRLSRVPGFEFPDAFPALVDFLLDELGYVWAKGYAVEDDGAWDIFSPDREYLGSLQLPPELRPLQIEADRITGVWTDTLGIETIRVFALERNYDGPSGSIGHRIGLPPVARSSS